MEVPHQSVDGRIERGAVAAQISREIVQLHSHSYGRGPTKAKTYVHDDYILCMLEDVFTPAERTLVNAGKTREVEAARTAFQQAVREEFVAIVERASGRRVRAFLSQVHLDPELSAELFMLDLPSGDPGSDGVTAAG
jgi:uncharacterized protein YbcI